MNRLRNLIAATILLAAAPFCLSLPAIVPGVDALVPFLGGVACLYLGLQFYCGDLAEV